MSHLASVLDARATFGLTVVLVAAAGFVLLLLIVTNLLVRVRRLELGAVGEVDRAPYGHLVGRNLAELLGEEASAARVVAFVSSSCGSCRKLLAEVADGWTIPTLLVWTTGGPARPPAALPNVRIASDGPALGARLGIRVTPFVLVADEAGSVVRAGPTASLTSFASVALGGPSLGARSAGNGRGSKDAAHA